MNQTHAQFLAELRGYLFIVGGCYATRLVALVVCDYLAWRRGENRTPAQRHTRSHYYKATRRRR